MKYHNSNLTDVENVGEQLRRIRKEKGLTQAQAAKLTYHTRDWLSNVEIGRTPITFVDAVKQLEAYDRLDEGDHLVQSIYTSAGTAKLKYYWKHLMNFIVYVDFIFEYQGSCLANYEQCEFLVRRSPFPFLV